MSLRGLSVCFEKLPGQVTGVSTKSKDGKAAKVEADAVIFAIGITGKQIIVQTQSCLF